MRLLRYILVPWTVFLVYSFFTFVFGQNGIYARRHLQAEQIRLSMNYEALKDTNKDFTRIKNNLLTDRDMLSVYARQLGYSKTNEEFIRIMGLGIALNSDMPAGQVFYAAEPSYVSDKAIKIISAFFGLAILLFLLIRDFFPFKV